MDTTGTKSQGGGDNTAAPKAEEPRVATGSVPPATTTADPVEEYPDPDEDDLDDLDDMLDDFSSVKLQANKSAETAGPSKPEPALPFNAPPPPTKDDADNMTEDEVAQKIKEGIAGILGELESSPDMRAQFEEMFQHMNVAAETMAKGEGEPELNAATASKATSEPKISAAEPSTSSTAKSAPSADEQSFQETIKRTMERMQNSGDQATAAAAEGGADDFMSEMLKQMSSGDFNGEGGEEEFSKMLMGMMEQLTNKDILYEPMKELHDKFPAWLEKNRATTPADDLKRFDDQKAIVTEIVAKFEEKTYSDSNAADREYIVDRMQKMQAAGSPPPDLVGDMESAQDAFNMPDDQCNPQ